MTRRLLGVLGAVVVLGGGLACEGVHEAKAQGLAREPEDRYLAFPVRPRFRAFLPPRADLADKFPTPGYQGPQGSCTAWAVGYSLRGYYARRAGLSTDISPSFIYNQINPKRGQCLTPTFLSDALTLVQKIGAVPLASFPYDPDHCVQLPTADLVTSARTLRIDDWTRVDVNKLDDLKGEIAHGNPVVFGMSISKDLETLKAGDIYDARKNSPDEGHAMVAVGYDEQRQAFKIINSWGTQWADGGFGWISYASFQGNADRAFVMRVAAPAPAPVPVPVPVPTVQTVTPPAPAPAPAPTQVVTVPPPAPAPAPTPVVTVPPPAPPPTPVVTVPPPAPAPAPTPVVTVPPPAPAPAPPPAPAPAPVVAQVVPPPPPAPKPVVPVRVDARVLDQRLAQTTNMLTCARVSHRVAADGHVELAGFVGSADDRAVLRSVAASLGAQDRLSDTGLAVRPWPQCEALLSFDQPFRQPKGLAARLASGGPDATFREDDRLVLEITTPSFPAYIYVTYLQAGGDAVHLLQPRGVAPRPYSPSTKLRIGEAPGPVFRVGPPFGNEMIVVLASASPLFDHEQPQGQIEREFLTEFRKTLIYRPPGAPRNSARVVAGTAVWLTTTAK